MTVFQYCTVGQKA